MSSHIIDGKFKSDKYEWCPPGFFPVKLTDGDAQDLLWEYAERHIERDAELSRDLKAGLLLVGYSPEKVPKIEWEVAYAFAERALKVAHLAIDDIAGWSGSSGNWPLQESSTIVRVALDLFKEKAKEYITISVLNTPIMRKSLDLLLELHLSKSAIDPEIGEAKNRFAEQIKYVLSKL